MNRISAKKLIFLAIFLLAAFFRLFGVNWDQNQHLHPDERFLTMVADAIKWPKSFHQYLDTSASPLNPHNRGFGFYVYGTFPVIFTRWVAENLGKANYTDLTLVGRQLSALFDLGTVVLVFLISREIVNAGNKALRQAQGKHTNKQTNISNWNLFENCKLKIENFPYISMLIYGCMVLPIQLSHFFAVDTYLTFFITLSFYFCCRIINPPVPLRHPERKEYRSVLLESKDLPYIILLPSLLGISFGLALAAKISAILFLPIIILTLLYLPLNSLLNKTSRKKTFFYFLSVDLIFYLLFLIFSYLSLRFFLPYLFQNPNLFDITLNPKVLTNWKELEGFNNPLASFPPAIQWITTKAYLFPLKNLVFWGMGLPLGILAIFSVIYLLFLAVLRLFKNKQLIFLKNGYFQLFLAIFWILLLFGYQGRQFVKALRYFYPLYPFLALISSFFFIQMIHSAYFRLKTKFHFIKTSCNRTTFKFLLIFFIFDFLFLILFYPISFISIYSRPHSRVTASYWIYQNIPPGATISSEEWDDGLPMSLDHHIHEQYQKTQFPLYWPDNKEKWQKILPDLAKTDYVILTSNRLYGSIMTVPERYPVTYRFYNALFDGRLGFEKMAEFTSRPNLPVPYLNLCLTPPLAHYGNVAQKSQECPLSGISFVDDYADETFTVYDHPKVIIFKKVKSVDYKKVLDLPI